MNNTIYTDLAPLGFAEWLEKNYDVTDDYPIIWADGLTINHLMRTVYNALAFRWLREEKGLVVVPKNEYKKWEYTIYDAVGFVVAHNNKYDTHELAEHHALCKALEIIKGGENGI